MAHTSLDDNQGRHIEYTGILRRAEYMISQSAIELKCCQATNLAELQYYTDACGDDLCASSQV